MDFSLFNQIEYCVNQLKCTANEVQVYNAYLKLRRWTYDMIYNKKYDNILKVLVIIFFCN